MGPLLVLLCQLLLTILVEGAVIVIFYKSKEILRDSLFVNLLTNPPLNLTLMLLSGIGLSLGAMLTVRIGLEIAVVFIEAIAYKYMLDSSFKKALWMSLILNLTSFIVGEVIGMAGYWKLQRIMMGL